MSKYPGYSGESLDELVIYDEELKKLRTELLADGTKRFKWRFQSVDGFFQQSRLDVDNANFDTIAENFGILKPWKNIIEEVEQLNANADENECYKLFFLARHGQGWHNVAEAHYGKDEWLGKWTHLYGDNETEWGKSQMDGGVRWGPDANLTPLGVEQAKAMNIAWKSQLDQGAPIPTKFYTSPFTRSCKTLIHTWDDIVLEASELAVKQHPIIKECLREKMGYNTCDQRSDGKIIRERFCPRGFIIEDGFVDEDLSWRRGEREPFYKHCIREYRFLNHMFDIDPEHQFVSVTSHTGTTRALLGAIYHRPFELSTGGMVPVVIKGVREVYM